MAIKNENELKGLFITDAQPVQQDFHDWIETMFHNDAQTAEAAEEAVEAIEAANIPMMVACKFFALIAKTGTSTYVLLAQRNVASVTGTSSTFTLNFITPFDVTNYAVMVSSEVQQVNGSTVMTISKQVGSVSIDPAAGITVNRRFCVFGF